MSVICNKIEFITNIIYIIEIHIFYFYNNKHKIYHKTHIFYQNQHRSITGPYNPYFYSTFKESIPFEQVTSKSSESLKRNDSPTNQAWEDLNALFQYKFVLLCLLCPVLFSILLK